MQNDEAFRFLRQRPRPRQAARGPRRRCSASRRPRPAPAHRRGARRRFIEAAPSTGQTETRHGRAESPSAGAATTGARPRSAPMTRHCPSAACRSSDSTQSAAACAATTSRPPASTAGSARVWTSGPATSADPARLRSGPRQRLRQRQMRVRACRDYLRARRRRQARPHRRTMRRNRRLRRPRRTWIDRTNPRRCRFADCPSCRRESRRLRIVRALRIIRLAVGRAFRLRGGKLELIGPGRQPPRQADVPVVDAAINPLDRLSGGVFQDAGQFDVAEAGQADDAVSGDGEGNAGGQIDEARRARLDLRRLQREQVIEPVVAADGAGLDAIFDPAAARRRSRACRRSSRSTRAHRRALRFRRPCLR